MEKPLTPKQERFCQEYLNTGNGSEAYRRAYPVSRNWKEASLNRKAKEMIDNVKIMSRLRELRAPAVTRCQVSLESHLNDLKILREAAVSADNYGAAINAEVARGKAAGLYDSRLLHRRDKEAVTGSILQQVLDGALTERQAAYMLEIQSIPLPEILKIELTRQNLESDGTTAIPEAELDRRYLEAIRGVEEQIEHLPERREQVSALKT